MKGIERLPAPQEGESPDAPPTHKLYSAFADRPESLALIKRVEGEMKTPPEKGLSLPDERKRRVAILEKTYAQDPGAEELLETAREELGGKTPLQVMMEKIAEDRKQKAAKRHQEFSRRNNLYEQKKSHRPRRR